MNRAAFIEYITPQLHEYNFTLELTDGSPIDDESDTLGYFCRHSRVLAVNRKLRCAFQVMVHEYAHFTQWRDRPLYFDSQVQAGERYYEWLDSHKPVTKEVLADKSKMLALEWDCERRALKLIDELDLRISKPLYARKANFSLINYHMTTTYHRWPKKDSKRSGALALLPSTLLPLSHVLDPHTMEDKLLRKITKAYKQ